VDAAINDYISREIVQERFGVTVDDAALAPENSDAVDASRAYLRFREGASQAGSRG
jgi:hypothetical protein